MDAVLHPMKKKILKNVLTIDAIGGASCIGVNIIVPQYFVALVKPVNNGLERTHTF